MNRFLLIGLQLAVAVIAISAWHFLTTIPMDDGKPLVPPFFFSTPGDVFWRIVKWFYEGTIWRHLWITLSEAALAFVIGSVGGVLVGFWFARQPRVAAVFDPYVKMINALPRVVLANARMLGANRKQLLRTVYLPSATSWVFSSLHTSVGLAFVGAVVGEYLGSARGVGYLILQAEGTFDVNTVFAGIVVLTAFALVLDGLVGGIERRLMKWQPRQGETEKL